MKNSIFNLLYFLLALFIVGCSADKADIPVESAPASSEQLYAISYKAPVFEKDDRIEKIKSIDLVLHILL